MGKSNGIKFSIIVFIIQFIFSVLTIKLYSLPNQDVQLSVLIWVFLKFSVFASLLACLGLILKKGWGRIISIFLSFPLFVGMILFNLDPLKSEWAENQFIGAIFICFSLSYLGIIYYLTREEVKREFN